MRIFILENCVVAGSVWFGGEEVYVDEAIGREMVEMGKAREMEEPVHRGDAENTESLGSVEFMVGRRERNRTS